MTGLTEKLLPVPTSVPPHEAVYQFIIHPVPKVPPLIESKLAFPLQITAGNAVAVVGAIDSWFTVTVTEAQAVLKEQGAGV